VELGKKWPQSEIQWCACVWKGRRLGSWFSFVAAGSEDKSKDTEEMW